MTRKELLKSNEYWLTKNRNELFRQVYFYLKKKKMSKSKFAKKVGLSEGYINRVLGGDFDGNFTNLVKISMAIGKIPIIKFKSLDKMLKEKI